MARELLTSTPSSLFAGPSTCKGICLPAIVMLWQIPKDAGTWGLVKAKKSISSWQIMFFMSQHILAVLSRWAITKKLLNIADIICIIWHITMTSTNLLNKYFEGGSWEHSTHEVSGAVRLRSLANLCNISGWYWLRNAILTSGGLLKGDV